MLNDFSNLDAQSAECSLAMFNPVELPELFEVPSQADIAEFNAVN